MDGEEYRFKIIFLFFPRKGTSVLFIILSLAPSVLLVCSRNTGSYFFNSIEFRVWN